MHFSHRPLHCKHVHILAMKMYFHVHYKSSFSHSALETMHDYLRLPLYAEADARFKILCS